VHARPLPRFHATKGDAVGHERPGEPGDLPCQGDDDAFVLMNEPAENVSPSDSRASHASSGTELSFDPHRVRRWLAEQRHR
jgi:hypothetical protein